MRVKADALSLQHPAVTGTIGVAVSGGSDSVALLVVLHAAGMSLRAVTVNHNLRPEAAEEARAVAHLCMGLGIPHDTLVWNERPEGNVQAAARAARSGLIAAWAARHGIGTVALGHTLDDQAETVLMRLRRGSGVDGLSAMRPIKRRGGVVWWRPLLELRREALRNHLRARGVDWIDDPSNEDEKFERVRTRKALETLEGLGLDAASLANTAKAMQRARDQLEHDALALARLAATPLACGAVQLDLTQMAGASAECRLRLLAHALRWVAAAPYRPRLASLEAIWTGLASGQTQTLHGCLLRMERDQGIEITREKISMGQGAPGELYDGRWQTAPAQGTVAPLGENGLAACPRWRETGLSRTALAATPALWRNGELHAAPFAGRSNDWQCQLKDGTDGFFAAILTH